MAIHEQQAVRTAEARTLEAYGLDLAAAARLIDDARDAGGLDRLVRLSVSDADRERLRDLSEGE